MRTAFLLAGLVAAPVGAQDMGHMHMPGMTMPMPPTPVAKPKPTAKPHAHAKAAPRTKAAPAPSMAGMDHAAMEDAPAADSAPIPAMDHAAMGHGAPPPASVGNAPPPPLPAVWAADATYGTAAMDAARHRMMREEGGRTFYQILFNLAEVKAQRGRNGFRWDGEGWFGGDIDRLAIRTEGEGTRDGVDAAELQLLWSRAIGRYANLQAGMRQDLGRGAKRTYATIAAETILPYLFEVEGRLFLSTRGELRARAEGWYDLRVTQRLVLQPRVELNLAAQSRAATGVGAGLTQAEAGLRLRYEIAREFAPYVGVSYEAETGRTADFSRAAGRDPTRTSLVAGVRFWF